jgi:hypothetical protein
VRDAGCATVLVLIGLVVLAGAWYEDWWPLLFG